MLWFSRPPLNYDFLNNYYKNMELSKLTTKIDSVLKKQYRCDVKISKLFKEIELIDLQRMRAKAKSEIENI